jgi:IclR family transcriptional regulator, KDG regulon repressor
MLSRSHGAARTPVPAPPEARIRIVAITSETKHVDDFEPVKSALRTVEVLTAVSKAPDGLTFGDILDAMGWPRSSTYNLLQTLTMTRFLELNEDDRRYRIGIRLWEAAQGFELDRELAQVATPFLEEANTELDETVQLAILDGIENVYIAKVEAHHHLKLMSEVGSRLPAHATGLGKVLLAGLSPEEVERRFAGVEMQKYTSRTLSSLRDLQRELEAIRNRGYAVDTSEYTIGVYCVAVPIRDRSERVVAAISASVPEARVNADLKQRMVTTLTKSAARIEQVLGLEQS